MTEMTPERLAEIRKRMDFLSMEARDVYERKFYSEDVPALLAEVERLRLDLADTRRFLDHWRASYERLSRQLLRRHFAWQSARRGRRSARLLNTELIRSMELLRTERDRLAEQVKRVRDPDLIRRAIADPGAYVQRKLDDGEPAETVPAWSTRAVIAALDGTEAGT